jgi:hypothetical protein
MASYDELTVLLETTGYRVAGPTVSDVALPCITIEPTGIELVEGFPLALDVCEVTAVAKLGEGDLGNWDVVRTMTYAILNLFMGTEYGFGPDIPLTANVNTNPASIVSTLTVSFPGDPICTTT